MKNYLKLKLTLFQLLIYLYPEFLKLKTIGKLGEEMLYVRALRMLLLKLKS